MTLSMPYTRRMISARPSGELMSGTSTPFTSVSGWVSKVSTAGVTPRSCARRLVICINAAWPRCTPSKNPSAITLFVSAIYQTSKKLFIVCSTPSRTAPSIKNSPSAA